MLLVWIGAAFAGMMVQASNESVSEAGAEPESLITFVAQKTSDHTWPDVFLVRPDGAGFRQLTNDQHDEQRPQLSPDAQEVVYWVHRDNCACQDPNQVVVQNTSTGQARTIPYFAQKSVYPKWSPDGQQLIFVEARGVPISSAAIAVINRDGSGVRDVLEEAVGTGSSPFVLGSATFSPNMQEIAYLRTGTNALFELWMVNADGTGDHQVAANCPSPPCAITHIDWSPDGSQLVLGVYQSNPFAPYVATVPPAGGDLTILGRLYSDGGPAWSPDGSQIVYHGQDGLEIMNDDGQDPERIDLELPGYGVIKWPDWGGSSPPAQMQVEFTQAIQQLQSISGLKADLEEDGQPPVPIIAGKPAVMRVYFPFVEQTTERTVEVTGQVDETRAITLSPEGGCDAVARRRENAGCRSVDFYFTPPEGAWSVTLTVRDDSGTVLREDEFNLVSVKTDDVLVKAVSVCDSKNASGNWLCQDPFPVMQQVSLMRRMFPTANVRVIVTGDDVRVDEDDTSRFPDVIDWWGQVARDLDGLHNETDRLFESIGQETYYYGLVRNEVPGGILGAAYLDTRGAAGKVGPISSYGAPALLSHEVGHAMGLGHTDTGAPELAGDPAAGCWLGARTNLPEYPYQDNMLRSGDGTGDLEVGFDVANGDAIWGDYYFEVMGYCFTPPDNLAPDVTQWITPFSTLELMDPAGPLSVDPAIPQPASASIPANYWLLQGTLTDPTHVAFSPIIEVTSEGQLDAGSGSHRIEVRGNGGTVLFTRMFSPAHGHGSPSPNQSLISSGQTFSELIPVQAGATSIDVIDPFQTVIGHLDLGGAVPTVNSIQLPADFSGTQTVSWSASDPDSTELSYWVAYSPDGGQTWRRQAQGLKETSLRSDFGTLAGSDGQGIFRVTASDGVNSSEMTSAPFTVASKTPRVEIIGPSETSFRQGDLVWLEAAAWDVDDGTLDDGAVTWVSNRDGNLGSGGSLPVYDLSVGTHTITMTARDSDNNTVIDSITVTVSDAPIVEGEEPGEQRTWGDSNCSGAADPVDALLALRFDAGQSTSTGECPPLGETVEVDGESYVWGDIDCSGVVDPVDGLKLLRHDSGLSVSQEPGCPVVGTSVTVAQAVALRSA
jgi:hypothetical protein